MARTGKDWLEDMRLAITDVEDFTRGIDKESFLGISTTDRRTLRAVSAALMQIGEAVKGLPEDMKARHPHIEWRQIAGLRDFLAHHYHRLEAEILWDVFSGEKFQELKVAIEAELGSFDS